MKEPARGQRRQPETWQGPSGAGRAARDELGGVALLGAALGALFGTATGILSAYLVVTYAGVAWGDAFIFWLWGPVAGAVAGVVGLVSIHDRGSAKRSDAGEPGASASGGSGR